LIIIIFGYSFSLEIDEIRGQAPGHRLQVEEIE
jgi:hypothetical protein